MPHYHLQLFVVVVVFKKLYKTLSEVKLEVETVIKTGRHIVQKQQTDNPKGMDEQLTSLKVLYNDLGAQVRACGHTSPRAHPPSLYFSFLCYFSVSHVRKCLLEICTFHPVCFQCFWSFFTLSLCV